ncbi:MAG: hypothetical protein OEX11_06270 [Nitrosomonas sp.]|nr:hypothetical protein [Nitrosomonas sp.]
MDELAIARVLHILGVVLWIGGVSMVVTVLLPILAQSKSTSESLRFFEAFRNRFAAQARYITLLVGLSGFYMVYALNIWYRFLEWRFWWMHAMVFIWMVFSLMLFILEPRTRRRQLNAPQFSDPERIFNKIRRMHWILLSLSLITIAGAVLGSHGY